MMNFSLNNRYFKGGKPLWIVGLLIMVGGLVTMFIQGFFWIGLFVGIIGLIWIGLYFGSRAKDEDITDGINIRLEELRGEARADYESQFDNTKKIGSPKVFEFVRFLYTPDPETGVLKTRKSSFGEIYTSRYALTLLYVDDMNRLMYVYACTLNLIADGDEMEVSVLPYEGFDKTWLTDENVTVTVNKANVEKVSTEMHIRCKDDSVINFPVVRDASIETLVDDMNIRYGK